MVFEHDAGTVQHVEYHQRRANQELALARRAHDVAVKKLHKELAERHSALAAGSASKLRMVMDQ